MNDETLYQVRGPFFTAGALVSQDGIVLAAPILGYTRGWTEERFLAYCKQRGFGVTAIRRSVETPKPQSLT